VEQANYQGQSASGPLAREDTVPMSLESHDESMSRLTAALGSLGHASRRCFCASLDDVPLSLDDVPLSLCVPLPRHTVLVRFEACTRGEGGLGVALLASALYAGVVG